MIRIENNQVFSDTGKMVRRKGTDNYFRRSTSLPGYSADMFEEVDSVPAYTKAQYDEMVASLVRERYTESEELAIQRKTLNALMASVPLDGGGGLTGPAVDEFAEYNAYVEEYKLKAKDASLYAHGKGGDA